MTEPTALLLASLSHRWAPIALSLPVVFGAATYASGVFLARSHANTDGRVRRWARAARVLAFNLLALSVLGFLVSISHCGCAGVSAHSVRCMSNLKLLAQGALMYAQDNDDTLPPPSRWSETIAGSVARSVQGNDGEHANGPQNANDPFHCPAAGSATGYGMNAALAGQSKTDRFDSPSAIVMLFDADSPTKSFAGGTIDLATSRHEGAPNVAFADGHVKSLNAFTSRGLVWNPTPAKPVPAATP